MKSSHKKRDTCQAFFLDSNIDDKVLYSTGEKTNLYYNSKKQKKIQFIDDNNLLSLISAYLNGQKYIPEHINIYFYWVKTMQWLRTYWDMVEILFSLSIPHGVWVSQFIRMQIPKRLSNRWLNHRHLRDRRICGSMNRWYWGVCVDLLAPMHVSLMIWFGWKFLQKYNKSVIKMTL